VVELTLLAVLGQIIVGGVVMRMNNPLRSCNGDYAGLLILLLAACWLALLAMRQTLPSLTTRAEIFNAKNLTFIGVFLISANFGFFRRVPAVNFSLNPQMLQRGPLVLVLAFGGLALVITLLILHVRQAYRGHQLYGYLAGMLIPVLLLVGITLCWRQTHYLHLHHYCWSLILVFLFRYDAWWSRIPQAIVLGIFVDGAVSEGILPIWYAYSP